MKYLTTLLLAVFFVNISRAQVSSAPEDFIRKMIPADKKIVYVGSIDSFTVKKIRYYLNKDTIKDSPNHTLILTKEEHSYINGQLDKMLSISWPQNLFKNSVLIKTDTLNSIFNRAKHTDGWSEFYKRYGWGYYDFSNPIFLRNNTLCIFYSADHCGWLCAEGNLIIYSKKGDKWVTEFMLYSWIS